MSKYVVLYDAVILRMTPSYKPILGQACRPTPAKIAFSKHMCNKNRMFPTIGNMRFALLLIKTSVLPISGQPLHLKAA